MGISALSSALLLFLVVSQSEGLPSLKAIKNLYSEFAIKYGRVHADAVEANMRLGLFMKSLQTIDELNARNDGATYGINKFADWTDEELSKLRMKDWPLPDVKKLPEAKINVHGIPVSFDWRSRGVVTPVKNQGQCGSCYSFSAMALVESLYAIKTGRMVDLSEQQLLDCTPEANGCDGGNVVSSLTFLEGRGALTEAENPYKMYATGVCPSKSGLIFVKEVTYLGNNQDLLPNYLYTQSPYIMRIGTPKSLNYYTSGVYHPTKAECDDAENNGHLLLVVGYGVENGQKYYLIKNSWGTSFGLSGYFKMARGENVCGNEVNTFGATIV